MTNEHQAAEADAKDVDLREAERVADLWLAIALRKLARDRAVRSRVEHRLFVRDLQPSFTTVLLAVADELEGA